MAIKEIRAVGIINWAWFVFYLDRDEFSPNLSLYKYANKHIRKGDGDWLQKASTKLAKRRGLAHEIDNKLMDVK